MRIGHRRVGWEEQNHERQELEACEKLFEEKASAAGGSERPALERLIDFAREGDEVVVHSIDRLARDLVDLPRILECLNAKGVRLTFRVERFNC